MWPLPGHFVVVPHAAFSIDPGPLKVYLILLALSMSGRRPVDKRTLFAVAGELDRGERQVRRELDVLADSGWVHIVGAAIYVVSAVRFDDAPKADQLSLALDVDNSVDNSVDRDGSFDRSDKNFDRSVKRVRNRYYTHDPEKSLCARARESGKTVDNSTAVPGDSAVRTLRSSMPEGERAEYDRIVRDTIADAKSKLRRSR